MQARAHTQRKRLAGGRSLRALLLLLAAPVWAGDDNGACNYRVTNSYPHDRGAFTQGLLFARGKLYESTGLFGQSTLREVDLTTGRVLRKIRLPVEDFGEGLALVGGQLLQLTWTTGHGYIWDLQSFEQTGHMPFLYASPHLDGAHRPWGLCYDQTRLVLSNGSPVLHFLDAQTYRPMGSVTVHDENGPLAMLNELECIESRVLANVWRSEFIAIINPSTGAVTAKLDMSDLHPPEQRRDPQNFLNGIAYNAAQQRLYVTGKRWPRLFEIELTDQCLTPP